MAWTQRQLEILDRLDPDSYVILIKRKRKRWRQKGIPTHIKLAKKYKIRPATVKYHLGKGFDHDDFERIFGRQLVNGQWFETTRDLAEWMDVSFNRLVRNYINTGYLRPALDKARRTR